MSLGHALSAQAPVYTPEEQARSLRTLLGGRIVGVWQIDGDGTYPGALSDFSDADARAHYAGERTFAIAAVTDPEPRGRVRHAEQRVFPKTHLLGFDVDERYAHRLPLIARELQARKLEAAAIATSGSDPGRGKVLVFFHKPYDARRVRNLGKKILDAARLDASWGIEVKPVELYPLGGTGGLLRIGGRNRKAERSAFGCDVFFDFDGQPRSLSQVEPAQRLRFPVAPVAIPVAPVGAWVSQALTYGLDYELRGDYREASRTERPFVGNTAFINRFVTRLAFEAIRFHCGQGAGYAHAANTFRGWLERIASVSPGLQKPSPSNRDERHPLDWDRRGSSAWNAAVSVDRAARERADNAALCGAVTLSTPGRAKPLDNVTPAQRAVSDVQILTENERKVLPTLYDYARLKGVTPDCFGISYREIATYAGLSDPQLAHRAVKNLVRKGYAVIHDRGTRGKRGLPTILGLVSETPVRLSSTPSASSAASIEGRQVIADSEAARRCAAVAEMRPNLRARRKRIEQFRNGTWNVEPQREDQSMNDSSNVVDFGRRLAARRPNAPALHQEQLLNVAASGTPAASTKAIVQPRTVHTKHNQFSAATTLFENADVQTSASVQTAVCEPRETASLAVSDLPSAVVSRNLPPADSSDAARHRNSEVAPATDEAILAEIALRGHGLSGVARDALLSRLTAPAFDALRAEAESAAEATHSFLRAVPARFDAFVRAKVVEIVVQRQRPVF